MSKSAHGNCVGGECTIQRVLPFAGPITAFAAMLAVMALLAVPAMMG